MPGAAYELLIKHSNTSRSILMSTLQYKAQHTSQTNLYYSEPVAPQFHKCSTPVQHAIKLPESKGKDFTQPGTLSSVR